MCKCTPNKRTTFCGKPGCEWPSSSSSFTMVYKCDELKFVHAWEDVTPNIVYATYPPSYPPKERKCRNCDKHEVLTVKQPLIEEWVIKGN